MKGLNPYPAGTKKHLECLKLIDEIFFEDKNKYFKKNKNCIKTTII